MIFTKFVNIIGSGNTGVRRQLCAKYCQAVSSVPVDKNTLSKLRKSTGFAFSNCRKALVLHNNDFDKALEWLNAEAAKEGWAKASKLQHRPMSQGVIGFVADPTQAFLLQMNCETDFVARNVEFLELVSRLTNMCFDQLRSHSDPKLRLDSTELGSMSLTSTESVADTVAKQVGTLGENLRATRAVYMSAKGGDSFLGQYVHTSGVNPKYLQIEGCRFGKFVSLVRLAGNINSKDIDLYGNQLAQHVVGMNPKAIGSVEDPGEAPKAIITESRTEDKTVEHAQEGDGIEGEDQVSEPVELDETRLLFQDFLLDPDHTTKQWLEERELIVKDYTRIAVSGDDS